MQLSSQDIDGAQVIRVEEDRIDAAVAIQFKDRMREIAGNGGRIILDLGQVGFVDSSGLGAIVAVMKFLAPAGRLELAALTPNVSKVFHMTRMDSVFTIHLQAPGQGHGHAA
ncbi:MAG TPA: STAS domain-containing protein [Paracoccaceae bacterium]|nr:STAS domain-containing protein [Paracoccaceae bacterium]